MRPRIALLLCLLLLPTTGCLRVEVSRTRDPGPAFAVARREAMRFQGRKGPARELGALIWSADEKQLVHARVPMWLVRKFDRGREAGADASAGGETGGDLGLRLSRRLSVRDLDRVGLGLLFELEEEQGERVLVWLQ